MVPRSHNWSDTRWDAGYLLHKTPRRKHEKLISRRGSQHTHRKSELNQGMLFWRKLKSDPSGCMSEIVITLQKKWVTVAHGSRSRKRRGTSSWLTLIWVQLTQVHSFHENLSKCALTICVVCYTCVEFRWTVYYKITKSFEPVCFNIYTANITFRRTDLIPCQKCVKNTNKCYLL